MRRASTVLQKALKRCGWDWSVGDITDCLRGNEIWHVLFAYPHEFAKAFFGEKDLWYKTACTCGGVDFHLGGFDMHKDGCAKIKAQRGYEFHLKKMVTQKYILQYLDDYMTGRTERR